MTQQGAIAAELMLRVLAGPNAGAEMRLSAGEWLIGTATEADILLAEPVLAPQHVRLVVEPGGVRVTALAPGTTLQGAELPVGEAMPFLERTALAIGSSVLAFGPPGASWTLQDVPSPQPAAPAPAPEPEPPQAVSAPPQAPVDKPRRAKPSVLRLAPVVLPMVMMGAAGGAGLWWVLRPPPPREARPDLGDTSRRLAAALRAAGLQDQVEIARRGDAVTMRGLLRDEEALRKALAAQREAGVPVEAKLATEAQLLEQGSVVLRALGLEGALEQPRPGYLVLRGTAPDAARVEEAVRRLRTDLPLVRGVEDRVVTPDRARGFLDQRLREGGLAGLLAIGPGVQDGAITVTGSLGPSGFARWQQIEGEFRARYAPHLRLEARIGSVALPAPRGLRLGSAPLMVMEDGRRYGVGDSWAGARIVAIEEDRVRIRGPGGEVDLPYVAPPAWVVQEGPSNGR